MKMPVIFLGHGSPLNAIEDNQYTRAYQSLGKSLPPPKAILFISAHWETIGTWVTGMDSPKTIHDFQGFPKELYDISYPAKGSPELAAHIKSEIDSVNVKIDEDSWGLDHGCWSVLLHMFPKADIPVLQLSLDQTRPFKYHYELGRKLKFLREENALIIASGNIVHNLSTISWDPKAPPLDWALEFDNWFKNKVKTRDFDALINEPLSVKAGAQSIPSPDHYAPLLYILGASCPDDEFELLIEGIQNASISMTSFKFG